MISTRLLKNVLFKQLGCTLLVSCFIIFFALLLLVVYKSIPLLEHQSLGSILTSSNWSPGRGHFGFLPFVMGSLWITVIAILLAVPPCLLTAIYLVEYASEQKQTIIIPFINLLAALPSVLFGVWGVLCIVPGIGKYITPLFGIESTGYTVLAAGIVLAVMLFPILISITVEVLKTIPSELKAASLSLGATKWETIYKISLRKAKPGIIAAIILAISKALGETIAVLMVCGNIPKVPHSLFDGGYPIPALIANNFGEMMSIPLYDSALLFAALLLMIMIIGFNWIARWILNTLTKQ